MNSDAPATGIEIFVFKGAKFLGSRCFSQPTVVIGRGREAALKLQDAAVSDRHAIVRLEGGDLVLADAGGTGVAVNGERIRVCRVSSVDEVAIGPFRLKLSILGHDQATDHGFGSATDKHAAVPDEPPDAHDRSLEPIDELRGSDRDDATLPKLLRLPAGDSPVTEFDDAVTKAQSSAIRRTGARPTFSARDRLGDASRLGDSSQRGDYVRDAPTRDERPRQPSNEAFDEFRHEATTRKADPPYSRRPRPVEPDAERLRELDGQRERAVEDQRRAKLADEQQKRRAKLAEAARAVQRAQQVRGPVTEAGAGPDADADAGADADSDSGADADSGAAPFAKAGLEEPFAGERRPAAGDDDDDLEEENWVEPFSLLENIVRERFKTPIHAEPFAMIEGIHYQGTEIVDLLRASPGESLEVGQDRFNLVTLQPDGKALVYFQRDFSGTLVARGKARPLKSFCRDNYLVDRAAEVYAVVLQEGDYAQVLRGSTGYLLRFVKPPVVPHSRFRLAMNLAAIQSLFASAAFHFSVAILFGIIGNVGGGMKVENEGERFAKIALTDVNLEKLKEETKIETKKEEPRKDEPKIEQPKDVPKPKKIVHDRAPKLKTNVPISTKQKERIQKKAVANVLSALENLKPAGPTAGRSDLKALTSNISAVRVPGGGSAANFKISGVIGKGVGDGVRLAGGIGGGGGKDTRVGSQLLAGGTKIGNLAALAGTGTRAPRARVARPPARSISTSGGTLSREAIQQVVNAHMHEVQACYERQLLSSPGLSGKIVFDWVIEMGGSVSSSRQASSTMKNPQVAMCVLALIRTWRFPSPVGGSVQVRYPFVFRVQGF